MDYTRQRAWFDPTTYNAAATVVGCGGIGSFAAFALAKLGIRSIKLVDFDTVDQHNIPNQLFGPGQLGELKVVALAKNIQMATGISAIGIAAALEDGIPRAPVVISALDSMAARVALWQQVKYKLDVKLFLDGRLAGEHVVLYSVDPSNPADVCGYEATLHRDAEGVDLPCTARAIIDVGFAVGSLIARSVRRYYAHEQATPTVYLNQETLSVFKGGWPE